MFEIHSQTKETMTPPYVLLYESNALT